MGRSPCRRAVDRGSQRARERRQSARPRGRTDPLHRLVDGADDCRARRRCESTVDRDARRRPRASVRLRGHETWGHVEVEPRIDGSTLVLQVTGVAIRRRRPVRRWLTRVPAVRRPLQLPPGVVLDDVAVADRRVVLHGALREWREPVSAAQLEELITRVRSLTGGALDIPRHAPDETPFSTATPPTSASPTT